MPEIHGKKNSALIGSLSALQRLWNRCIRISYCSFPSWILVSLLAMLEDYVPFWNIVSTCILASVNTSRFYDHLPLGVARCIWWPKAEIDYHVLYIKLLVINMNHVFLFFLFFRNRHKQVDKTFLHLLMRQIDSGK